jgi:phosphatidylserine/phosphatidylglycerophosphate/cardiolipin synthase-like enzyme
LSVAASGEIDPFRCVGNHNRDKRVAFPRMHNKFLVFCRPKDDIPEQDGGSFDPKPYAVWTGSFNLTKNAGMSLENALFLTDPKLVKAYFEEWEQIMTVSEPLDWERDWAEPEWRIGT